MPEIKKQYPESLRKFTGRMMKSLKGAYSNFRPNDNPDQAQVYGEAISRMVEEFGRGRTAVAIAKAVDLIPDFVPTIAKIRQFMPLAEGQIKTCTLCHPSGFVYVYEGFLESNPAHGKLPVDPKVGAVKRCGHVAGKSPVEDIAPPGERLYGTNEVKALWKIHAAKRAQLNRSLIEKELAECVDQLDRCIDGRPFKLPKEFVDSFAFPNFTESDGTQRRRE